MSQEKAPPSSSGPLHQHFPGPPSLRVHPPAHCTAHRSQRLCALSAARRALHLLLIQLRRPSLSFPVTAQPHQSRSASPPLGSLLCLPSTPFRTGLPCWAPMILCTSPMPVCLRVCLPAIVVHIPPLPHVIMLSIYWRKECTNSQCTYNGPPLC